MTNQEIRDLLNLCNQRTLIYNKNLYSVQKGDKIKFQSIKLQHQVQYNIGDIRIQSDYIQDSLYDATVTSYCKIDDQPYKLTMIQSCRIVEEDQPRKEEVVQSSKRADFPRSLSSYTQQEIRTIVEELREIQYIDEYYALKDKYNIHGASLNKLCRMYGIHKPKFEDDIKNYIRDRKLLSDDDELLIIQTFINIMSDGTKSKEAIKQISLERKIHPDILKDIYNENKIFISKKLPFVPPTQKNNYQDLNKEEKKPDTPLEEEEVTDNMLQDLKAHFNR